jgi:hypothetical protein
MAGCAEDPLAPQAETLRALEPYNPIFKLNEKGYVVELKVEGRFVSALVLDHVGKLTEIKGLSLYAASLTDESLASLQNLKHLGSLGLGNTPITDKGIEHLEKIRKLRWLWLPKSSKVSESQVAKLTKALPNVTVYWQEFNLP